MDINVMSWNIDWFRDGCRSGKTYEYIENDCSIIVYGEIVKEIKTFLKYDNSIVFLQEVPYLNMGDYRKEYALFQKIMSDFPETKYDVIYNGNPSYRCSMSISVKGTFKGSDFYKPRNNRTIAVEKAGIILMGVHMPTGFECNDVNDKMWSELIEYIKDNDKKIVVSGDFNVYVGCNQRLTEQRYIELLNYSENIVSEEIITFGNTSIDKFLINEPIKNVMTSYTVETQEKFENSDHKYIKLFFQV